MIEQQQVEIEEPCNNIVAQSDYEAALAAIESTFDNFRLSQQSYENESLDPELVEEIYKTAKTSLLNNVKRVVRPVHDDDYNNYVDQYHFVSDDEESDSDENESPQPEEESAEEDAQEEIDMEELIDGKAWKDAQKLRARIREMSNKVQTVREEVLQYVDDGILSSISEHLVDRPVEIVFENDNGNETSDGKENSAQATKRNIALQNSLRDLTKVLKDPKWKRMPNRIQSLQDTIETVEKETSEDRVMSQTEIAILSKPKSTIDESRRKMLLEDETENEDPSYNTANAMDRLALFGQLFA